MKKLNYLALGAVASLAVLAGCQDEDFGYSKEQIQVQSSFEKHFGELKPDQIWDFSSYNLNRLGLEGGFNNVGKTRTAYNGVDDTPKMDASYALTYPQFYKVPDELHQWIDKNLREEVYNKKRGTTNFTLKMPTDRDIVIIPIYQGQAGLNYNLCIKSEEKDESEQPLFPTGYIWEKSAGIEWAELGTEDWHGFGGDKSFYAHTVGREVHANPVRIMSDKVQGNFSLYLDLLNLDQAWDGASGLPFSQTFSDQKHASSLDGQMVAISLANSPETFQAVSDALKDAFADPTRPTDGKYTFDNFLLVGVEDSNLKRNIAGPNDPRLVGTDWDMNDMIFLIVGIKPDDLVYTKDEVISKRYMIEDLGSDFDYDFNDIVIDVTQRKHTDEDGVTTTTQTLSLKHLCGTIPWRVQVGDYTSPIFPGRNNNIGPEHFSQDGDPGYDPTDDNNTDRPNTPYRTWKGKNGETEVEGIIDITITGWDPDANNIIVTAWPDAAGEDIPEGASSWTPSQLDNFLKEVDGKAYGFPEDGKYPFIIACDQSNDWYPEHITIPADAIVTWKKAGYETIITPGGGGGGQGGEGGGDGDEEYEDDEYDSFIVPIPSEPDENGNFVVEFGEGEEIIFDSWTDDIVINPEYLQNIQPGYKIITHFTKIDEGEDFLMYMKVEAPWENIGGFFLSQDQTELEITVSPGNIDLLKTYGIALKGKNVKISKIEIIPGEWEGYGVDLPWDGNKQLWWDGDENRVVFKPENFTDAVVGDQIRWDATGSVQLHIPAEPEWIRITESADGKYTLTAEQIAAMKTWGLVVLGNDVTLTHVELYHPLYVTLTLATTGSGSGTFTGAGTYESGTSVTFEAIANPGSRFVQWNDGVTTNPRTITLEESITYTAEFVEVPSYTITFGTTGTGTGTISGATTGTYYEGTSLTVTATPDDGSRFVRWSDGDTNPNRTITVSQAATYTAEFELIPTPTITFATSGDGSGAISGATTGTYREGTTLDVTATPETGSHFVKWSDGDTNASRTIVVGAEDATYTAQFDLNIYTITLSSNAGGTVSGAGTYKYGEKATLTATPDDNYAFVKWSDGVTLSPREVTVEKDLILQAFFTSTVPVTVDAATLAAKGWSLADYVIAGGSYDITITVSDGTYVQFSDYTGDYFSGEKTFSFASVPENLSIINGTANIVSVTITAK